MYLRAWTAWYSGKRVQREVLSFSDWFIIKETQSEETELSLVE